MLDLFLEQSKRAGDGFESTRTPSSADVPIWILGATDLPYFITGSVRFGVPTKRSDLDIALLQRDRDKLVDLLIALDIPYKKSDYNIGIKTVYNGVVVNFVFLHPLDYVAWHKAAKMAEVSGILSVTDSRPLRHSLHEMLVAIVKSSLSHNNPITLKNYEEYL